MHANSDKHSIQHHLLAAVLDCRQHSQLKLAVGAGDIPAHTMLSCIIQVCSPLHGSLLGLATLNQICAQSHCCPLYLQEGVMIKEAALH